MLFLNCKNVPHTKSMSLVLRIEKVKTSHLLQLGNFNAFQLLNIKKFYSWLNWSNLLKKHNKRICFMAVLISHIFPAYLSKLQTCMKKYNMLYCLMCLIEFRFLGLLWMHATGGAHVQFWPAPQLFQLPFQSRIWRRSECKIYITLLPVVDLQSTDKKKKFRKIETTK